MEPEQIVQGFDFENHRKNTIDTYLFQRQFYADLSSVVAHIVEESIKHADIKIHSIQHREKDPISLGKKAIIPSDEDSSLPKYRNPLVEITDLAGVRIITHFPATLKKIDKIILDEFNVIERSDKGEKLVEEDKFGYQSIHYLVKLKDERARLSEYERFSNGITEIQVRTILQHAWAEIEHDIQYKSSYSIPAEIHRRFMSLAGLLEIADREFQAIQDEDSKRTTRSKSLINQGRLSGLEIAPMSLKLFLDNKFGPDGRMADWSYDYETRILKTIGFKTFKQLNQAIDGYDGYKLSEIATRTKAGQIRRFHYILLASMGQIYLDRHPQKHFDWFKILYIDVFEQFKKASVAIGEYDPLKDNAE